jgi:hypothetical protein
MEADFTFRNVGIYFYKGVIINSASKYWNLDDIE